MFVVYIESQFYQQLCFRALASNLMSVLYEKKYLKSAEALTKLHILPLISIT